MLNKRVYEGKTKEEVLNKIQEELNTKMEDLYIEEEIVNKKLFKSGKCTLTVVTKEDIKKFIAEFIEEYSKLMNIEIKYEINEIEKIYNVTLVSENNPILIGREGKTLEAFQLLLRQALQRQVGSTIKANVDISGYKNKKMKTLEYEVKKIAHEVQNSKIDASLDPMNSYERRKIHTIISEMKNLTTESVGEGKERHIVIKYVEEAQ
jgi:spoIIIJ-associated protein